jgi:hypothetical protein
MQTKTKVPRIFRYKVTQVWGSMTGRMEMGQVIFDKWKNDRDWFILNFTTMEEGGWHAKLLGEATPDQTAEVHARWAAERHGEEVTDGE